MTCSRSLLRSSTSSRLLHATYWQKELPWLKAPAGFRNNEQGAKVAGQAAAIMQSALEQFADEMPPAFRRLGEFYVDRYADINALYREGQRTLVHGDDHIGNLFIDGEGRVGFYDWAIASVLPGMRDVGYFLANSLPTELRRQGEDALISRYCAALAERGVTLDEQTAGTSTGCTPCTHGPGARPPRPWGRSGSRSRSATRP